MGLRGIFLSIKSVGLRTIAGVFTRAKKMVSAHVRLAMLFLAGLGIILCLLAILAVVNYRRSHPKPAASPPLSEVFKPLPIPPEDLFIGEEPDFLPELLWEREPRPSWGPEDARPFWTDPLKDNRRVWEERADEMMNKLLEDIP
ncbi:MAG: hypothetical protein LBL19_06715 [Spirochaetaceae bacterium]|jgi:hypothetical protein|nr:hypothetical protein [Spirochaetaceae bacterium]